MTNSFGCPPMWGVFGSFDWPSSPWQAAHCAILSCSDCAPAVPGKAARKAASAEAVSRLRAVFSLLPPIRHAVEGAVVVVGDEQGPVRHHHQVDRTPEVLVVLHPAREKRLDLGD